MRNNGSGIQDDRQGFSIFEGMKNVLTSLACLFSVSVFAQLSNESILVDGLNRTYTLYLPSGFNSDASLPLVLNFHGGAGTANDHNIAIFSYKI